MYAEILKRYSAPLLWIECHSFTLLWRSNATKITWSSYLTLQIYTRKWDKVCKTKKKKTKKKSKRGEEGEALKKQGWNWVQSLQFRPIFFFSSFCSIQTHTTVWTSNGYRNTITLQHIPLYLVVKYFFKIGLLNQLVRSQTLKHILRQILTNEL